MAYEALARTLGINALTDTPFALVQLTRQGLPGKTLSSLAKALKLTVTDMGALFPVSTRTLQRYTKEKMAQPMPVDLSDHLVQVAKVFVRAVEVMGDEKQAIEWLHEPCVALGKEAPISLFDTSAGIAMVEETLGRLEYGVFS